MANVLNFGADPTGVNNSVQAFKDAVNTGDDSVYVPGNGSIYCLEGSVNTKLVTLNAGQRLFSDNANGVTIKTTSSARVIELQPFCTVENIGFVGSKSKTVSDTYQTAIVASTGDNYWKIRNCKFQNFGGNETFVGGAVYVAANASMQVPGASITDNIFTNCYNGIVLGERAEYIEVVCNKVIGNKNGMAVGAGNCIIYSNNFQTNSTGLKFKAGANNGHGIVYANNINHNTVNLEVSDVTVQGMTFFASHFYAGDIKITNSKGIMFYSCDFVQGTITLTNNTCLQRVAGRVPKAPTKNAMTVNVVSGECFADININDF